MGESRTPPRLGTGRHLSAPRACCGVAPSGRMTARRGLQMYHRGLPPISLSIYLSYYLSLRRARLRATHTLLCCWPAPMVVFMSVYKKSIYRAFVAEVSNLLVRP